MGKKEKIIFREKAKQSIRSIVYYIVISGYPETAKKFNKKLVDFANSLAMFPNKYPVCRHKRFAKHNYRCAVFEHDYIFIYKTFRSRLVIYNVVHCSRIR